MGIAEKAIANTTLAVVDLETTGLYPGGDRVVEVAVVRMAPGKAPELVLDTLINPQRRVSGTEIHGITDADVRDAPRFEDVAGNIVEALAGCVFASYNVYFDSKFMQEEFLRVGVPKFPPHLCLMYMRPMLGLGSRCTLQDACRAHGVKQIVAHHAGADALAAAYLWMAYLTTLQQIGSADLRRSRKAQVVQIHREFLDRPADCSFVHARKSDEIQIEESRRVGRGHASAGHRARS